MGHDNLHLSIFGADPQAEPLLNIGNRNLEPLPVALTQPESPAFLDWLDSAGNRLLSTSSLISLRNGEQVRVVLSLTGPTTRRCSAPTCVPR